MLKILAVLMCLFSMHIFSQPLIVGIPEAVFDTNPKKMNMITSALNNTGLPLDIRVLPAKRSLMLLARGDIAIDVYRHSDALVMNKDIIKLKPAVDEMSFWLVTHPSNSNLCNLSEEQYARHTVVGVLGFRYFNNFVYKKFHGNEQVNFLRQALKGTSIN